MNKLLMGAIPIFLLLSGTAYATYAGDTLSYHYDKCNYLIVNITGCTADEWTAQNCTEDSMCNFYCNCTDGYVLNLTSNPYTIGEYNITNTVYFEKIQTVQRSEITWFNPHPSNTTQQNNTVQNNTSNNTNTTGGSGVITPPANETNTDNQPEEKGYIETIGIGLMSAINAIGQFFASIFDFLRGLI